MTSKIVVNNIEADAGVSTVTFNSNVERGSSNLHSTGLNVNNTFVHSTGIALGAGSTIGAVTGVTTYYGDGSQLTGISAGPTLTNGADNRVITATGANALNAESGFTFDGTDVQVPDKINLNTSGSSIKSNQLRFQSGGAAYIDQYNTSQSINIRMSSSSALDTTAMTINHNGHTTKPSQPGFEASYPDGYNTSSSPNNYVTNWLRVHHNYGSHFNQNNGRFTAPVNGRYLIGAIMTNVGHSNPHVAFGINGGAASGSSRGGTNYTELWHTNAGSGSGLSPVHIFDLSANDYVNVWLYDYTGTADDPRCYFFGYLLG